MIDESDGKEGFWGGKGEGRGRYAPALLCPTFDFPSTSRGSGLSGVGFVLH